MITILNSNRTRGKNPHLKQGSTSLRNNSQEQVPQVPLVHHSETRISTWSWASDRELAGSKVNKSGILMQSPWRSRTKWRVLEAVVFGCSAKGVGVSAKDVWVFDVKAILFICHPAQSCNWEKLRESTNRESLISRIFSSKHRTPFFEASSDEKTRARQ